MRNRNIGKDNLSNKVTENNIPIVETENIIEFPPEILGEIYDCMKAENEYLFQSLETIGDIFQEETKDRDGRNYFRGGFTTMYGILDAQAIKDEVDLPNVTYDRAKATIESKGPEVGMLWPARDETKDRMIEQGQERLVEGFYELSEGLGEYQQHFTDGGFATYHFLSDQGSSERFKEEFGELFE